MRRRAVAMVAALSAAAAVAAVSTAGAQVGAAIVVQPATADPGGLVKVSNGRVSPCPPPAGTANPSASVDLYSAGSATPVNHTPYQGTVAATGAWSVDVRLAPDMPPGSYKVQAGCYTDSGLNAAFGPTYDRGSLEVRLQDPGLPTASASEARPGDSIQVSSGDARCPPPPGAASPRVRASLLDAGKATRAEAETSVDAATGRWSVNLRVPELDPQSAEITAVCLARVGAPAPYARYRSATFAVEAAPPPGSPTTTGPAPSPTSTAPPAPGATTTSTQHPGVTAPALSLPTTPLAEARTAEPTYTG